MKIVISENQFELLMESDWKVVNDKLVKTYKFEDYDAVLDFVGKVGEIAKKQNHHPDMLVKYDSVKLTMFDHEKNEISDKCYKFTNAVDKMMMKDEELDERSRSFAFTRKRRLYSKPEVNANPLRYKKETRINKKF